MFSSLSWEEESLVETMNWWWYHSCRSSDAVNLFSEGQYNCSNLLAVLSSPPCVGLQTPVKAMCHLKVMSLVMEGNAVAAVKECLVSFSYLTEAQASCAVEAISRLLSELYVPSVMLELEALRASQAQTWRSHYQFGKRFADGAAVFGPGIYVTTANKRQILIGKEVVDVASRIYPGLKQRSTIENGRECVVLESSDAQGIDVVVKRGVVPVVRYAFKAVSGTPESMVGGVKSGVLVGRYFDALMISSHGRAIHVGKDGVSQALCDADMWIGGMDGEYSSPGHYEVDYCHLIGWVICASKYLQQCLMFHWVRDIVTISLIGRYYVDPTESLHVARVLLRNLTSVPYKFAVAGDSAPKGPWLQVVANFGVDGVVAYSKYTHKLNFSSKPRPIGNFFVSPTKVCLDQGCLSSYYPKFAIGSVRKGGIGCEIVWDSSVVVEEDDDDSDCSLEFDIEQGPEDNSPEQDVSGRYADEKGSAYADLFSVRENPDDGTLSALNLRGGERPKFYDQFVLECYRQQIHGDGGLRILPCKHDPFGIATRTGEICTRDGECRGESQRDLAQIPQYRDQMAKCIICSRLPMEPRSEVCVECHVDLVSEVATATGVTSGLARKVLNVYSNLPRVAMKRHALQFLTEIQKFMFFFECSESLVYATLFDVKFDGELAADKIEQYIAFDSGIQMIADQVGVSYDTAKQSFDMCNRDVVETILYLQDPTIRTMMIKRSMSLRNPHMDVRHAVFGDDFVEFGRRERLCDEAE